MAAEVESLSEVSAHIGRVLSRAKTPSEESTIDRLIAMVETTTAAALDVEAYKKRLLRLRSVSSQWEQSRSKSSLLQSEIRRGQKVLEIMGSLEIESQEFEIASRLREKLENLEEEQRGLHKAMLEMCGEFAEMCGEFAEMCGEFAAMAAEPWEKED